MGRSPGRPLESARIYPHQRQTIIKMLGREGTIALIVARSRVAFANEQKAWSAKRKGYAAGSRRR